MGRLAALFGPFCECHVSYLSSVEEPGSFGAGNDFERHAVGDAGDEVADAIGSGERRNGQGVGQLGCFAR